MSKHYSMITETCNCGTKVEIEHPDLKEAEEFLVRWRKSHKHDWDTHVQQIMEDVAPPEGWVPLSQRYGSGTTGPATFVKAANWYTEGKDWIWGEDGRVWVADRPQPADFAEWDKRWPKGSLIAQHEDTCALITRVMYPPGPGYPQLPECTCGVIEVKTDPDVYRVYPNKPLYPEPPEPTAKPGKVNRG